MCHIFFFLLLWKGEYLYESAVVSLPIRYDSFWYAVHNIAGNKRIKIVFYWIAGGVY